MIEMMKTAFFFLGVSKALGIFPIAWGYVCIPVWPLSYIYLGCIVCLICNFVVKICQMIWRKLKPYEGTFTILELI